MMYQIFSASDRPDDGVEPREYTIATDNDELLSDLTLLSHVHPRDRLMVRTVWREKDILVYGPCVPAEELVPDL
jgi:hypothetical protein